MKIKVKKNSAFGKKGGSKMQRKRKVKKIIRESWGKPGKFDEIRLQTLFDVKSLHFLCFKKGILNDQKMKNKESSEVTASNLQYSGMDSEP
jgi:hypothetical protein